MLKMLLDPMGGIVLTNDGNAILREVRNTKFTLVLGLFK
jgi:chaperonin GroEL (HSP60 family)